MKHSVMTHKRVLGIDRDLSFLRRLEKEISQTCPGCQFDKATTFEDGRQLILLLTYDQEKFHDERIGSGEFLKERQMMKWEKYFH